MSNVLVPILAQLNLATKAGSYRCDFPRRTDGAYSTQGGHVDVSFCVRLESLHRVLLREERVASQKLVDDLSDYDVDTWPEARQ